MKKDYKVLYVATSRETMGGITSVLKRYERMPIWNKYHCSWLETQINKSMALKVSYALRAYLRMLFLLPKYDIIHFHTVPGRSVVMQFPVFLYSLIWRKKIITHIHVGNQLLDNKDDILFRFVLKMSDRVIVLAKTIQKLVSDIYHIQSEVVYNPIEEQPLHVGENSERFIFFAAMLRKFKGYRTLLRAYARVCESLQGWRLVIAGNGEVGDVAEMINSLGIADCVTLYTWRTKEQMDTLYRKAGIFCIASEAEGFPMTFLEAASHGIPIISTPVGGLVDVLDHGNNALIFDFGDEMKLGKHLVNLTNDADLRGNISSSLRNLVRTTFSFDVVNESLDKLYKQLIEK